MDVDYRSVLKRYMAAVITDDCVVGIRCIENMEESDRIALFAIAREVAEDEDDSDINSRIDFIERRADYGG